MELVLCRGPPDMAAIGFLASSGKVEIWAHEYQKGYRQAGCGRDIRQKVHIDLFMSVVGS